MLHRLRSVLVRPGRDRLTGTVEVDETFIGGEEPGLRGGRAKGKKSLVGVAVEVREPRGYGRCRMEVLPDASAALAAPVRHRERRAGRDGHHRRLAGLPRHRRLGYTHDRRSQRAARARGEDPGKLLPGVHRVASLAKRWLLGTHQGSVEDAHLQSYLNEFVLPLQPAPIPQPRHGLLPRPRTRRRPRVRCATATWSLTRKPKANPPIRAGTAGPPTEPGPAPGGPALASRSTWHSPVS